MNIEKGAPRKNHQQIVSQGIRFRLISGFAAITLVLTVAIVIVLIKISYVDNLTNRVIGVDLPAHENSYDMLININSTQAAVKNWLLVHDVSSEREYKNAWNNIYKLLSAINLTTKNWSSGDLASWGELQTLLSELKISQDKLFDKSINPTLQASTLTTTVNPITNKIFDILDGPLNANGERVGGLFDNQFTNLQKNTQEIIKDIHMIRLIEYGLLVFSILLAIYITTYTIRGIMLYINVFRNHSANVAAGDLTKRIDITTHDEMGELGHDLNTMTESLASITRQITDACHSMVSTIDEVKHAVDVQSSGASEQASSINQITASLDEIEKSSNQTIEKAKNLGEVADRTREKGQMGLEAVEQSIGGMKGVREKVQTIAQTILDLSHQTQQVGEITGVVNSLAQQLKMLALNASIEAAKAGEAGAGFAVVAAEVKNLAEQSEQSTSQVQKILEDIRHATEKAVMATEEGTKGVDLGTHLVEQTGGIVHSLTEVIHETTIASQQIQAAIRQEGVGIEQITAGMNEINQVTTSFVDSVRQTTEAIGHLASMVANLKSQIDVYKI